MPEKITTSISDWIELNKPTGFLRKALLAFQHPFPSRENPDNDSNPYAYQFVYGYRPVENCKTLEDLKSYKDEEFLVMPFVGRKTLNEIRKIIGERHV